MNSSHNYHPKFPLRLARRFACLCAAAASLTVGQAQTTHLWTPGNGNWSNAARWTNGVPNADSADVYIDNSTTATNSIVSVDGDFSLGRLTLDAGDTLSINNFSSLVF